jgi:hypothetical protein
VRSLCTTATGATPEGAAVMANELGEEVDDEEFNACRTDSILLR